MKSWHGGKSAHAAWGQLAQCVNLPLFRLVAYGSIFYQAVLFMSILRSKIGHTHNKRSERSTTLLDAMLRNVRAVRKREKSTRGTAKDFLNPFSILTIYCNRVRQTGINGNLPTLSLNTRFIQQIQHSVPPSG
jgi:hypothetical protein